MNSATRSAAKTATSEFGSSTSASRSSEELHLQPGGLRRLDKTTDRETYLRRLQQFGLTRRSFDGPYDSSHMIVDVLYGTRQVHSLGNYYHLRILRARNISQTAHNFPRTHWFDGQPLDQM
jgi:hypothetical protein